MVLRCKGRVPGFHEHTRGNAGGNTDVRWWGRPPLGTQRAQGPGAQEGGEDRAHTCAPEGEARVSTHAHARVCREV